MKTKTQFWSKVESTPTCLLWNGAKTTTGYGRVLMDNRYQNAHRVAYEWEHGAVPAGLELDHLCRVRHCVNPDHLEPVSHAENMARAARSRAAYRASALSEYRTVTESAAHLGVSRRTFERLAHNVKHKKVGGRRLFKVTDLDAFMAHYRHDAA